MEHFKASGYKPGKLCGRFYLPNVEINTILTITLRLKTLLVNMPEKLKVAASLQAEAASLKPRLTTLLYRIGLYHVSFSQRLITALTIKCRWPRHLIIQRDKEKPQHRNVAQKAAFGFAPIFFYMRSD